jgi:hypothetical protein
MKRYLLRQRLRQRSREETSRIMRDKTAAVLFGGSLRIKKPTRHCPYPKLISPHIGLFNYFLQARVYLTAAVSGD